MDNYNLDFYNKYREYLLESTVRNEHDNIFRIFRQICHIKLDVNRNVMSVIDLGCGLNEFYYYNTCRNYVGIDKNIIGFNPGIRLIKDDYYNIISQGFKEYCESHVTNPNIFVSLFSIECCLDVTNKYILYNKIMQKNTGIICGLTSGFYYTDKYLREKVTEHGIESYQTIENPIYYRSLNFDEWRIHIPVPSKMFGPNVIEVWKIFTRRG